MKYSRFGGQLKLIKTTEASSTESFSTFKHKAQNEFKRVSGTMTSSSLQASGIVKGVQIAGDVGHGSSSSEGSSDYRHQQAMRLEKDQYVKLMLGFLVVSTSCVYLK